MRNLFTALLASAALCLNSAQAQEKPLTHAQVEAIVKKVIEENPELILKSVETFRMKQEAGAVSKAAQNIVTLQDDLNHNPNSPSIGNPEGDITVIEFFDYHCGYCKHFFPIIAKLVEEDKGVRVVFKEFPILSEDSVSASKAALAVNFIDKTKYFAFHTALMKLPGAYTPQVLAAAAKEVGIDAETFKKALENPAIKKELDHNKDVAQKLNLAGTPAIIIGTELAPGAIDLDTLKAKVAKAREAAKEKK